MAEKVEDLWSRSNQSNKSEAKAPSSTTTITAVTPPTEPADNNLWSGRGAVPWPSNTFQILEKCSNRAIALAKEGNVVLKPAASHGDASTHWLCVEKNGYFGFHNPKSGHYLGHDGKNGIKAQAKVLKHWEQLTPREHPEGGYQILFPYWEHTLMVLCVADDGKKLARRDHGTTLWEFVRV
ncbi:hypothetical protein IWX90DRAFT_377614 [Phyllosticta citrichinensis]|uniref:Uncharacterized protein n=1 Tax=Phyllosticta citrichinensis TaxID=1130410 RepID=A0ABR1Y4Y7_9PEZI